MEHGELLAASGRERALYGELLAVYRGLADRLQDTACPVDPAWMATQQARTSALADALGTLAAELAPHRLTGAPVAADVRDAWRASAELAAAAVALNAEVTALARARQGALLPRLAHAREGRRALTAYRPAGRDRAITEHRV